jgi:hypothetical protein
MSLRKLLEIIIKHNYYPDGICDNVRLNPIESTAKFLTRNDIYFRQDRNSWSIYKTINPDALFWYPDECSDNKVQLIFTMLCDDYEFYRSVKETAGDNEINCVCNKTGEKEIIAVPCADKKCKHFKAPYPVVAKMHWKIILEFDKDIFADGGSKVLITFNSKEVYWKYLLFTENETSALEIIDSESEVTFTNTGNETFPDGTYADVFISNCKMTLKAIDDHHFRLALKKNGIVKNVIKRLPVASVTGVRYLTNNKDDLVSSIFIHI